MARNDAILEDFLLVIDIVKEAIEGVDALLQALFQPDPLVAGNDAGNHIEGKNPLGTLVIAVNVEGDTQLKQSLLDGLLPLLQLHQ